MCGLVGFFEHRGTDALLKIQAMNDLISHRGPDASGAWVCPDTGLALGHRRLSILDLSPQGAQPMRSSSGRYVMVFNGEIYNFAELRRELEGLNHPFRGGSDTEVMLAAFEEWGIHRALERFNGMFAFALWDTRERSLSLGRDRVGKKPLYFGWNRGTFFFGSELHALFGHPAFTPTIHPQAVTLMVRYGYVPGPVSIYKDIWKLTPGAIRTITFAELQAGSSGSETRFWSLANHIDQRMGRDVTSHEAVVMRAKELLTDAVKIRMVADVPLGVFLSGGIDSSLVTAVMQSLSSNPVRTFSIGFNEQEYDEAPFARTISSALGTQHTEVYFSAEDALKEVPRMAEIFDEPFADNSQLPMYLVSRVAKSAVTVVLSGDGGDELCAGYSRYRQGASLWRMMERVPWGVRRFVKPFLRRIPESAWRAFFSVSRTLAPHFFSSKELVAKASRLAEVIDKRTFNELYRRMVSFHEHTLQLVRGTQSMTFDALFPYPQSFASLSRFEQMMYIDFMTYLVDDIMVKVDRTSMAVSLEARAPLLDYRLIEHFWNAPMQSKFARGTSKVVLKDLLKEYLNPKLFDRPKMGFGVPIAFWMRGALREWCEDLVSERALEQHGLFDTVKVRSIFNDFMSGRDSYNGLVWNIVMFQAWYQKVRPRLHV